jgi:hypothetical protein
MRTQKEIEDKYYYLVDKWDREGLMVWEENFKECLAWVLGDVEWEE